MSATIDERVVEMRFDNKQFENGAKESIGTLGKLKQALNLSDSAKGLENIQKAAEGVNIGGIGTAIEGVKEKFSALEAIALGALMRIGQKAVDAGERLLKSLTVEPISQGFGEYELKMGSVQTIMASTGESLATVNGYLDELNTYADKTIYSFSDMTASIGKFTNAGVKLEDAVKAIQGISNEAAVSGANTNEASRAMYNFAQALSTGAVKLIDWKSIENANMATVEFKQSLLDTALAMGTVVKVGDKYQSTTTDLQGKVSEVFDATSMFNDSLSSQWMTTDVLVQTLGNYSTDIRTMTEAEKQAYEEKLRGIGYTEEQIAAIEKLGQKAFDSAQDVKTFSQLIDTLKEAVGSGWAQTFELIFGDLEEAKALWTEVSKSLGGFIDSMSTARNELLKGGLSSGWKQLLNQGISDSADFIDTITTVSKESDQVYNSLLGSLDKTIQKTSNLSDEELESVGYTREQANSFVELRKSVDDGSVTMSEFFDKAIELNGGFEKSLKQGWLTSDILSESITKLADKTRGLSDEQLAEMGYTRAQVESIEEFEKAVKDGTISLDEFTNKMTQNSGRENLIDSIRNSFNALLAIIKPIKDAFREIFPPATADQLYDLTIKIREFTEGLKISDDTAKKIKRTFKGLFAVADILKQGIGAVIDLLFPGVKAAGGFADGVLGITASIGDWIVKLDECIKKNEFFAKAVDKIRGVVEIVTGKIKDFVQVIQDFVSTHFKAPDLSFITDVADTVEIRFRPLQAIFNFFGKVVKTIVNVLTKAAPIIGTVASTIGKALSSFGKAIAEAFTGGGFNAVLDLFNSGVLAVIGVKISEFIGNLSSITKDGKGFIGSILEIKDAVLDTFGAFQEQLKSKVLLNIAAAIGILAASLVVLSLIDSEKMTESLGAITVLFLDLFGSMAAFERIMGSSGMKSMKQISNSMIVLAAAVLILALAMKKISGIDSDKLLGSLGSVSLLLGEMAAVAVVLSKYGGKVKTGAVSIITFAGAIYILTAAVEKLGGLDVNTLIKGLTSVGVLLAELAAFMVAAKFGSLKLTQAAGIAVLAGALIILQGVVSDFGNMDTTKIIKGLTATGVILAELEVFSRVTGSADHILATSVAMIGFAAAMKLLESPMITFGNMSIEQIAKGLVSLGVALAEMATVMKLMPKNSFSVGLGLIEAAAGITIMSKALDSMGKMTGEEIAKGLLTMGVALAEMAIAMNAMKGTLSGSAAMLVMSAALLAFIPVLKVLGGMELGEIVKGLFALAGAFVVIGVAGAVLGSIVPAILGLTGAMALLGVAAAGIGVGLLAGAAGLTALAAAGVAAATTVVAMLEIIVVGLLNIISNSAAALGEALKTVILTLCDVIMQCVPEIVNTVLVVVKEVLLALAENAPDIVHSLLQLIIGIIDALAADLPTVIQSVVNLFMSFFAGVSQALQGIDVSVLIEGIVGIGLLSALMLALSALASLAPSAMVGVLAMGATIAELAIVLAAVGALAQIPGLQWLIGEGGDLLQGIGTAIGKFIGGIVGGLMSGVSASLPQIGADLSAFMVSITPFVVGANMIKPEMLDGVKALAETILLLTAADILQGLTSWLTGGSSLASFGEELAAFGPPFAQFAKDVKGVDPAVVEASANAAQALAELASSLPRDGGKLQWLIGSNMDMETFGTKLVPFGEAIMKFSETVTGLVPETVTNAATAGKALAELASSLPRDGGKLQWLIGSNMDMETFGTKLEAFGKSIVKFAESVTDLEPDTVTKATNCAKALVELSDAIPETGGITSLWNGDNDIADFGESLAAFGTSMTEYYNSVSNIEADKLTGVISCVNRLIGVAKATAGLDTSGMTGFAESLKTMGNGGIDALIQTFAGAGKKIADAVKSMIKSAVSNVKNDIAVYDSFYNAASYFVDGFCKGISDNQYKAEVQARDMAKSAADSAKEELKEKSPSKVGYQIGDFFGVAFVNAIGDYREKAGKAGSEIANSARNGLSNAISRVRDMVENDLGDDMSPVLTPVIDLSKVQEGAQQTASIFGGLNLSRSYDYAAATSAGIAQNKAIQNGFNNDLISAIEKLGSRMGNTAGNSYVVNGVTYDDGSNVANAVKSLVRAARIERRV